MKELAGEFARITVFRDERVGHMIWLLGAGVIAVLGFWYPEAVANRNASPDDRFGFVLLTGIPFEIVGSIVALKAMFGLIVFTRQNVTVANQFWLMAAIALTILSLSPLFIICSRLMR